MEERTVKAPREAMEIALRLAGGDRARLEVQADGSVLVLNRPRGEEPKRRRPRA